MQKKTKTTLVDDVYKALIQEQPALTKDLVQKVIDSTFTTVKEYLISGSNIEIRRFGVFEIRQRKARINARNPKNGNKVEVQDHSVVAFKSGSELKKSVWNHSLENSQTGLQ